MIKKLLLCLFMVGCFDASVVSKLQLKCSKERPGCQPGFFCYIPNDSINGEGMCVDSLVIRDPTVDFSNGTLITDLSQPNIDMSMDLTSPFDFSVPPSTCSGGGGTHIGNGIYACKGTWVLGMATSLCNNGKVCSSINSLQKSNCDGTAGFYFISAGGSVDSTKSVYECLTYTTGRTPIFYGCGQGGSTAGIVCNGAQGYVPCMPASSFTCTVDVTSIVSTGSTRPNTGVLCCP
jgi:hypothetical protein